MTLSTLSQELHVARSKRYALAGLVILGWEDAKYYVKAAEETRESQMAAFGKDKILWLIIIY